ncbi:hypothetical protein [Evansella halocellulosilytica]|uniref:hypothetical protein n=1 Tax=Evansella halocellulosilytica TaxID=2011013 RepID=UPI000BB6EF64|nr:hypothetical protein [Evansella halocellulosilytica]
MVITKEMPVSGIVSSWPETEVIFAKYRISSQSNRSIQEVVQNEQICDLLIIQLNKTIGSSNRTCIKGG